MEFKKLVAKLDSQQHMDEWVFVASLNFELSSTSMGLNAEISFWGEAIGHPQFFWGEMPQSHCTGTCQYLPVISFLVMPFLKPILLCIIHSLPMKHNLLVQPYIFEDNG